MFLNFYKNIKKVFLHLWLKTLNGFICHLLCTGVRFNDKPNRQSYAATWQMQTRS